MLVILFFLSIEFVRREKQPFNNNLYTTEFARLDDWYLPHGSKKVYRARYFLTSLVKFLFFLNGTFSVNVRRRASFHLNFLLIRETGYICRMTLIRVPGYTDVSLRLSVTIDPRSSATVSYMHQ